MDLSVTYMGMKLANPLVVSSSPLTYELDNIRKLQDAGAAAVVLHSLFEEQIRHEADQLEHYLHYGAERFAESLTYFPKEPDYKLGPEEYLELISAAKQAVKVPIIASLNGISEGGWISYAQKAEQSGADAIECNVYYIPTNPALTAADVEDVYVGILRAIKASVTIPVAMKLSPFFSSMANFMARLDKNGADALVLFNRFYQPDIDVDNLEVRPSLVLSTSQELRLPLRWIALLHGKVKASLAATSGVHSGMDAAKAIMAGADVVMMTSALLENGIKHLSKIQSELMEIMDRNDYASVSQMKGILSQQHCPEPAAFERANYAKILTSYGRTATLE